MLLKDALRVSPLGYAKRPSERGDVYATHGKLYLETGGVLRPIVLPPDKLDTWEPVLPEPEAGPSADSVDSGDSGDSGSTVDSGSSVSSGSSASPEGSTGVGTGTSVVTGTRGPDRGANRTGLDPGFVVVHREKRRSAPVSGEA
jgi:hypothetical protein